ncbi:MAG: peptide-methionine (R)-S-oxide reductase MsrB [Vicinamibacterales bacterium]
MTTRRQLLVVLGTGAVLAPLVPRIWNATEDRALTDRTFPVDKSDAQWRAELTPEQFQVLREHGTERAFTSPLDGETRDGVFVCAGCGQELFSSETKYDSGTGWPSFFRPEAGAVGTTVDRRWFMVRTEVHCARCGGHLGHVFPDGPAPTGERYCMNGAALRFVPRG